MSDLPLRSRAALSVQREVGRVLAVFWIPAAAFILRFLMRYRIQDAANLRKRYRALMSETDRPVLICANHLTMADSALVAWALGGSWWYVFNYQRMPWNLPEHKNFASVLLWVDRAAAWMAKCIPIDRGGKRKDVSGVLRRIQHLLGRGETALIFAEGGRSRTGRVQRDSVAHSVGRLVNAVPGCQTLCVYLRGERQQSWSCIPKFGDSFYVDFEFMSPESEYSGMRRSRDFGQQIVAHIAQMEDKYFACRK